MSAVRERSAKFKIPLQSEVQVYMREKKGWPEQFCAWYAEKYWNHYTSNGWKVGGRAPMKSWQAAFNSQWQDLKTQDVKEMFLKLGGRIEPAKVVHISTIAEPVRKIPENDIDKLDILLDKYSKRPTAYTIELVLNWPAEALKNCYDIIKENKLWDPTITKQDLQKINDERRVKATVIIRTLDYYGCKGYRFKDTITMRNKLQ